MFSKNINKLFRFFLTVFILNLQLIFLSCNSNDEIKINDSTKYTGKPKIEFNKISHDFGELTEGEIVECIFRYKNTGKAPLKILTVVTDCGCTVPEFSSDNILQGKAGMIKVVFNSTGFRNNIYKTIDVETNTESKYIEIVLTAFIKNNKSLN